MVFGPPPVPISMRRGFISSGTSRTRSTVSKPFSSLASRDLHVVGQVEALLEGAGGDAAMQELPVLLLRMLVAGDKQSVLLLGDLDLVRREARPPPW